MAEVHPLAPVGNGATDNPVENRAPLRSEVDEVEAPLEEVRSRDEQSLRFC